MAPILPLAPSPPSMATPPASTSLCSPHRPVPDIPPLRHAALIKRTAVKRQVNIQIVFMFIVLLALSSGSTIGSSICSWFFTDKQWYLLETTSLSGRATGFIEDILTFIILYNNLIPISLIITMKVIKFQ
ncbi:P-type ATPase [Heterobasidion irregulare TC 32-1]|uniref:P-type ATPase n=1 Tax=Heterobasidion irregulare (strain TC 32-1) TaxID=747525 RepID=W4JZL2_HETIT|nr:P-type ATPase [Heterobasidion irregulare TC 32-1]ETW78276.1 P-type ATPase [Heterobasidion irregulare TC 32-1]